MIGVRIKMFKNIYTMCMAGVLVLFSACSGSDSQFTGWQTEEFSSTPITGTSKKSFVLANPSMDGEQHVRAIAFDRGSNSAGHFRIERILLGNKEASQSDIVVPPGGEIAVTVTYAPQNMETTRASYGGWTTGEEKRWVPKRPDEVWKETPEAIVHRAIIEVVFDYPREGIFYVQVVGTPIPGPHGEEEAGGAFAACTPGNGVACYTGGFALDIPELSPGGPKALQMTGPIKFNINGGVLLQMDDFPFVIYYLRSEDIPKLPAGVTATLVISGAQGTEARGTFDGARLTVKDVTFRIRVALGELSIEQIQQGLSPLVDFKISGLDITTIKPLDQGAITLHLETALPENPSGNELFDQFLSGVKIVAVLEGELAF